MRAASFLGQVLFGLAFFACLDLLVTFIHAALGD